MKPCHQCQSPFEIIEEDRKFYEKVSPVFGGKKYPIPEPKCCPPCREQRRLAIPNVRNFYKKICDLCQTSMVSAYHPEEPYTVYCQDCWWGNEWDELDYGRELDFSRPFFEQMKELQLKVPRLTLMNKAPENSEFCNYAGFNKNCYLAVAGSWYNEDCLYGNYYDHCKSCVDNSFLSECELCYECIFGTKLYNCTYCIDSSDSSDCFFSVNLRGCRNVILSNNLRNKEYYIRNQPCTKEEFESVKNQLKSNKVFSEYLKEFHQWRKTILRPAQYNINVENSSGDYLRHCKNVQNGFIATYAEDAKNVFMVERCKDFMDCCFAGYDNTELFYECIAAGVGGQRNAFCFQNWTCNDMLYCDTPQSSSNCFGSVCVRNKKYCILNKQYSKSDYEQLVSKVIEHMRSTGEWGEFFPIGYSPFAYNETFANDFYPLSKEQVIAKGWKWRDKENTIPDVEKVISADQLPDSVDDTPDDILSSAIECKTTGRPFRLTKSELDFYRRQGFPIPRVHYEERHHKRMALHNPRVMYERQCDQCEKEIRSTYSSQATERVVCEECYLKSVY